MFSGVETEKWLNTISKIVLFFLFLLLIFLASYSFNLLGRIKTLNREISKLEEEIDSQKGRLFKEREKVKEAKKELAGARKKIRELEKDLSKYSEMGGVICYSTKTQDKKGQWVWIKNPLEKEVIKIATATLADRTNIALDSRNQQIAYLTDLRNIAKVAFDGTENQIIIKEPPGYTPSRFCWSPDGKKLAFQTSSSKDPQKRAGIYIFDLTTRKAFRLIPNGILPAWSPDGGYLAYSLSDHNIYVTNNTGSRKQRVYRSTRQTSAIVDIQWSPVGTKLSFLQETKETTTMAGTVPSTTSTTEVSRTLQITQANIYLIDAYSGEVKAITNFRYPDSVSSYSWSPDGQKIIFEKTTKISDTISSFRRSDIYIVNLDGTSMTEITKDGHSRNPFFSPNQLKIAFEEPDGIYLANPDGTAKSRLTDEWAALCGWH